jgi:hypothetical protein
MEMISQDRVGAGKGWYRPCFLLLVLLVQQGIHPLIYCAILAFWASTHTYVIWKLSSQN